MRDSATIATLNWFYQMPIKSSFIPPHKCNIDTKKDPATPSQISEWSGSHINSLTDMVSACAKFFRAHAVPPSPFAIRQHSLRSVNRFRRGSRRLAAPLEYIRLSIRELRGIWTPCKFRPCQGPSDSFAKQVLYRTVCSSNMPPVLASLLDLEIKSNQIKFIKNGRA